MIMATTTHMDMVILTVMQAKSLFLKMIKSSRREI